MKELTIIVILNILTACALPQPVPQWAIESCLRAHGTPVFTSDGFGNQEFRCIINDGQNSLNARYFNDSDILDSPSLEHGEQ